MKTKFFYIFLLGIIFASCSDMLDEEPKSIAVETFYNTPAEVEAALNAIYHPLHEQNSMNGVYGAITEACTDYIYGRGSFTNPAEYQGLDNTNISRVNDVWKFWYQSVRNANICIQNIPNGSELTEDQKKSYLAEAYFMRAFVYLHLVQNWGGVVLRTEENMTEQNIPRSTVDAAWDLIEKDLLIAQENLPDNPRTNGAPSKWSAKTVLTEVYLHLGKNSEARAAANEVMQSGKYALVEITEEYDFHTKLFGPDVVNSTEEIFYLKFSRTSNKGNLTPMYAHHPNSGYIGQRGWYGHYSDFEKNPVLKNWDKDDLRCTYNWYLFNTIGLGETSVLNKKFQDKDATGNNACGNDMPMYRYAELLLYFAEAEAKTNGVTDEGIEALNQVRRRAYGNKPAETSDLDFTKADFPSVDKFMDYVIRERGYETIYEGKRWNDLKRLGIAKKVIKEVKGIDIADKHLLWPIPVGEMNYNEAIDPNKDQNPGY